MYLPNYLIKYFFLTLFCIKLCLSYSFAQVIEKEKDLRKVTIDSSLIGWKTGGLFNITFSQVTFTNWASGGENSFSANGLVNILQSIIKSDIALIIV